MLKGIDVSKHQGIIDWAKVKNQIDFAVLRVGYGSDIQNQDDTQFQRNVTECEKLGIPYAVYLYSYAKTEVMIRSEAAHTLRLIKGHKPFAVYGDFEEACHRALGRIGLTKLITLYCSLITSAGFKAGVYASKDFLTHYIDADSLVKKNYSIWCACWTEKQPVLSAPIDIWQNSSNGSFEGITGRVDTNFMIRDILPKTTTHAQPKKTVEQLAQEVIKGLWGAGEERKQRLGNRYAEVQKRVNEILGQQAPAVQYYPAPNYTGASLIDALKAIKVDSSKANRTTIAAKNGIKGYTGTSAQNTKLLSLLKSGKLVK